MGPSWSVRYAGANYGTSGQTLTSAGSGDIVQWTTVASVLV